MIDRSRSNRVPGLMLPRLVLIVALGAVVAGCGVVALPVRTASAVVKTVPVAGHVAAAPLDATADAID